MRIDNPKDFPRRLEEGTRIDPSHPFNVVGINSHGIGKTWFTSETQTNQIPRVHIRRHIRRLSYGQKEKLACVGMNSSLEPSLQHVGVHYPAER
ncbi:hypothetical protein TNCV_304451 [Trichonephila clavipes]|nr:hypothetical protein TNCV_304451 [Trichonephila clavipes]